MIIEQLDSENVHAATRLVHSIFPDDAKIIDNPGKVFRASIKKGRTALKKKYSVRKWEYLIVYLDDGKTPIGTTGLYTKYGDPKGVVWLGWFCVHPIYRRHGYGSKILRWTIKLARKRGKVEMRLYTSTGDRSAQRFYEKMGFKIYYEEKGSGLGYTTLYRKKSL